MTKRLPVVLLMASFVGAAAPTSLVAQTPARCQALADAKRATYGFHPAKLSASERKLKTAEMDAFWNLAKGAGAQGLACIADFIATERDDTYFLFDAASLLAEFDKSGRSDAAIVSGLSKTDLADLSPPGFIAVAIEVATRGADIGPAAHNYINASKVTAYLPAHGGYKLDRTAGAILLYGRMSSDIVDKYLAAEVTSPNRETRDTAAIVWSLNMTDASFKGLASLGEMADFSAEAREHVRVVRSFTRVPVTRPAQYTRAQILERIAKWPEFGDAPAESAALDNAFYTTLTLEDLPTIRDARRRVIAGVSDESIEAYNEVSRMLMNLINVLDAYKEFRIH